MDGQFQPLVGPLAQIGIDTNLCAANEHIPEIERAIRFLKERI